MKSIARSLECFGILLIIVGTTLEECHGIYLNHFAGYSIFFVGSGFVSAQLLQQLPTKSWEGVYKAFLSRLASLLPVYYLALLVSISCSLLLFSGKAMRALMKFGVYAALGGSNLPLTNRSHVDATFLSPAASYYEHFVMAAFLLQATTIFYTAQVITSFAGRYRRTIDIGLIAVLLLCSIVLPTVCGIEIFRRFAPFWVGAMIGLLFNKPVVEDTEKIDIHIELREKSGLPSADQQTAHSTTGRSAIGYATTFVGFSVLLCLFIPYRHPKIVIEVVSAAAAALVLASAWNLNSKAKNVLEMTGRIAWPVLFLHQTLLKYLVHSRDLSPEYITPIVLGTSLLGGITLHFAFERPLQIKGKGNRPYYVLQILLVLIFSILSASDALGPAVNARQRTALAQNNLFVSRNYSITGCEYFGNETGPHGYCAFPNGNGKLRVLLVGNELAVSDADAIYESFKGMHGEMRVFSKDGFVPLYVAERTAHWRRFRKILNEYKPHVLIVDQDFSEQRRPAAELPDRVLQNYQQSMALFHRRCVQKVIIVGFRPNKVPERLEELQQAIRRGEIRAAHFTWDIERIRETVVDRLRKLKGPPLVYVDLMRKFEVEEMVRMYNNETLLSHFDNNFALTNSGIQAARGFFDRIARTALTTELVDESGSTN